MKYVAIVGLVVVVLAVGCGAGAIGKYNTLVQQEQSITAQYTQNQNNYDNFVKAVLETAQVSQSYAEDLKVVFEAAISGRYGDNGSQAVFQWITEQNPQLDARLYVQVQQVIEGGRRSFQTEQKLLIDKKNEYEVSLRSFPTNIYAQVFGFPKIDLTKYGIVTSNRTEEAFKTGKDEAIEVRPTK